MITEFYPNPNKPKFVAPVTSSGFPPGSPYALQANGFGLAHNEYHAKKKKCTVEQFIERDMLYKQRAARCTYTINSVVYPHTWEAYQEKGKCRILKIDRSYAESELEWENGQPLFLVEAISEKNNFAIFRATPGYFQNLPPTEPKPEEKKDPA